MARPRRACRAAVRSAAGKVDLGNPTSISETRTNFAASSPTSSSQPLASHLGRGEFYLDGASAISAVARRKGSALPRCVHFRTNFPLPISSTARRSVSPCTAKVPMRLTAAVFGSTALIKRIG